MFPHITTFSQLSDFKNKTSSVLLHLYLKPLHNKLHLWFLIAYEIHKIKLHKKISWFNYCILKFILIKLCEINIVRCQYMFWFTKWQRHATKYKASNQMWISLRCLNRRKSLIINLLQILYIKTSKQYYVDITLLFITGIWHEIFNHQYTYIFIMVL